MNKIILSTMPTDPIARVNSVIKDYQDAKGLEHGFQKDAIQNSVGARGSSTWNGWKCKIDLIDTDKGKFLIITDSGTEGLTGPNLSSDEIQKMCDEGKEFDESWRLARISANNVSGRLTQGAGLFGIGKTLYSAASNNYKFYFESLTKDFGYRVNVNDKNRCIATGALENDEAAKYLKDETGLSPIDKIGTRIIICNPKKSIIDSIKDGTMKRDIAETWWRIFDFFKDDEGIYLENIKVSRPKQYEKDNILNNYSHESDVQHVVNDELDLKTKKIGFNICKELDESLGGFYFYRRGMKVGEIVLDDIVPKKFHGKYYGYIELQSNWENVLKEYENTTHYGIISTKKNRKEYQDLRNFVRNYVNEQLRNWGLVNERDAQNRYLHSVIAEIKENIQELFKDEGFENLGKGDEKAKYTVRLKNVIFPNPSERKTVHDNDVISFGYDIKNNYLTKKEFNVNLRVVSADNKIHEISHEKISIESGETYKSKNIEIKISEKIAEKYSENTIVLAAFPAPSLSSNAPKRIIFYYDAETPKNKLKDYELVMAHREMPRISDRRVNTNESISNIVYSLSNNIEKETKLRLIVSTHNLNDRANLIETVFNKDFTVKPYESIESDPFSIKFSEIPYNEKVKQGKIDIRAKIVIAEDNGIYEKGTNVGEYKYTIFFNTNEKKGIIDSFQVVPYEGFEDPRCSYSEGNSGNWVIKINVGHPEYQQYEYPELQKSYITRLIIKEFAILYIKESKYTQLGFPNDPEGNSSSHLDIIEKLNKKIDELWWKTCQK